jgi:hypothetical protein
MTSLRTFTTSLRSGHALVCVASLVSTLVLGGCGGGSSTPAAPVAVEPVPTTTTLSGTVAVGAPMLNAVVTVKDANGVTKTVSAGVDGGYSGLSTIGMVAPFELQACGMVDGNYTCFYSLVQQAGVANVTPLTHANIALALGSDPAGMFAATAPTAPPSASSVEAQRLKLKTALADLLAKAGITDLDFTTGAFNADRSGMDKVLDSIKISTGTDGATAKAFVQMEGIIGSGNVFLDKDAVAGTLTAGSGADVDLKGISTIFVQGMSFAVVATDAATCTTRMNAAGIFDDAFTLNLDKNLPVTKVNAAAMICQFASISGLLGGTFANPTLRNCDFTTDLNRKVCTVGFNIVKGDLSFDGAELAVVLRPGAAWKLLGRDSVYEINIGAAIQRSVRIDFPNVAPSYTRAITFDITADDGVSPTGIRAAKVYQRNLDGSGWEATPLVTLTLTDACIAQLQNGDTARLAVFNGSCGSSWLSLGDSVDGANAAAVGDQLIDNFYKRGRKVKVELFNNVAATGTPVVIIKRVDGVPPKFAALAGYPWIELTTENRAALVAYDGVAPTFTVNWLRNTVVSSKDVTFCLGANCQGGTRAAHEDTVNGSTSRILTLDNKPASAAAFKQVSMYGRNADQLGVQTNFMSCGGATNC